MLTTHEHSRSKRRKKRCTYLVVLYKQYTKLSNVVFLLLDYLCVVPQHDENMAIASLSALHTTAEKQCSSSTYCVVLIVACGHIYLWLFVSLQGWTIGADTVWVCVCVCWMPTGGKKGGLNNTHERKYCLGSRQRSVLSQPSRSSTKQNKNNINNNSKKKKPT